MTGFKHMAVCAASHTRAEGLDFREETSSVLMMATCAFSRDARECKGGGGAFKRTKQTYERRPSISQQTF